MPCSQYRRQFCAESKSAALAKDAVAAVKSNTLSLFPTHLVLHQRNERADDHRRLAQHQRRHLVAQRLAAARGLHRVQGWGQAAAGSGKGTCRKHSCSGHSIHQSAATLQPTCHDHQVVGALIQHGINHTLRANRRATCRAAHSQSREVLHLRCRSVTPGRDSRPAVSLQTAANPLHLLAVPKAAEAKKLGEDGLWCEGHGAAVAVGDERPSNGGSGGARESEPPSAVAAAKDPQVQRKARAPA